MLAFIMMTGLAACDNTESDAGFMTLVLAGDETTVFEVELDKVEIKNGLVSVLDYLKSEEVLEYEISGTYLNKVGEIENNAANAAEGKYLYVYTSVTADMDVSQYAETVDYEGQTLTSSGVGANEMHIEDGCVIYIGYIVWN